VNNIAWALACAVPFFISVRFGYGYSLEKSVLCAAVVFALCLLAHVAIDIARRAK